MDLPKYIYVKLTRIWSASLNCKSNKLKY